MNGYLQNIIFTALFSAKILAVMDILSAHTSLTRSINKRYLYILSLPVAEHFKRLSVETFKNNSFVLSTRGRNLQKTFLGLSTHGRNLQNIRLELSTHGRNLQNIRFGAFDPRSKPSKYPFWTFYPWSKPSKCPFWSFRPIIYIEK
ncbi:MAG: hypothetical protein LBK07_03495 [Tannerella sp.]|jgi:hypothetical protein|nr:hypothetical protein [Tannerella sp.]